MNRDLWALLGIIIVAVVYELDHKIGMLLFAVVALAAIYTLVNKYGVSYETPITPIS